jgi:hypothetical protein
VRWFNSSVRNLRALYHNNRGAELCSVGVVNYPVYSVVATIKVFVTDEYSSLDKHLLKAIQTYNSTPAEKLITVFGLPANVIELRLNSLNINDYVIKTDDEYSISNSGKRILTNDDKPLLRTTAHIFYIDGLSLQPLPIQFYNNEHHHNNHTYLEVEDRLYSPDYQHTPTDDTIINNILNIPVNERSELAIPKGLHSIESIDPHRKVHPLGLSFSVDEVGNVVKSMCDLCHFHPKILPNNLFPESFLRDVKNSVIREGQRRGDYWDFEVIHKADQADQVYDISNEIVFEAIKQTGLGFDINVDDIDTTKKSIAVTISKHHFDASLQTRIALLKKLSEGYFFMYQPEQTGVWQVYVNMVPKDEFTHELLTFHLLDNISLPDLLDIYPVPKLRELCLVSCNYELLEKLDIRLYMD